MDTVVLQEIASILPNVVPCTNGPLDVLDAGCGTGNLSKVFKFPPFHEWTCTGIDISAENLREAALKGFYNKLSCGDVSERLDFVPVDSFDLALCISVTTMIQPYRECSLLEELVRVTRPKGHFIVTYREDVFRTNPRWREAHDRLISTDVARVVREQFGVSYVPDYHPHRHMATFCYMVFQVSDR